MIDRRSLLVSSLASIPAATLLSAPVFAQSYPVRPVSMIVPFPAGGPTDVPARIIAHQMGEILGQQIVIDNRAGASGNIGTGAAAKAEANGYNLLFATGGTHGINPSLFSKLPYDAVADFEPVVLVTRAPNVFLAANNFPGKTVSDIVKLAKENPGKLNFASAGLGTTTHMSFALMLTLTGAEIVHVPYRGGGPAMNDLIGGQIPLMVDGLPSALPHVKSGSIKAIAVTSLDRATAAPDIPTVAETLPGFEAEAWYAIMAPKKTPVAVLDRLNAAANEALKSDFVKQRCAELGATPIGGSRDDARNKIAVELEKWKKVAQSAGLKLD
jgi:tripartite-type tricarboxylate transporter receptor subunit TctC